MLIFIDVPPCFQSIDRAHSNMKPGRIYRSTGELGDSSLNRSPHSYLNNPEDERHRYTETRRTYMYPYTDLMGDVDWCCH